MPRMDRRQFIQASTAALGYTALTGRLHAAQPNLKIGVTDWNLNRDAKPASIELARSIGFDGVEISLGRAPDRLPLGEVALQEQFLTEAKKQQFPIAST